MARRRSSLSTSLPDVSLAPDLLAPPLPAVTSPSQTGRNFEDDSWADKIDPSTGSVFYVAPPITTPTRPERSFHSSDSSLSSTPSLPEHPPPPSSLPEHPSSSFSQPSLKNTFSVPEEFSQSLSVGGKAVLTSSPKPRASSFTSRLRKAVTRRHRHFSEGRRTSISQTASIPDLNQLFERGDAEPVFSRSPLSPVSPPPPHASLYGSHGIPLSQDERGGRGGGGGGGANASIISTVEINLAQYCLGTQSNPCSLDALGIVPAHPLDRRKFTSLSSLRWPTSSSSKTNPFRPVKIRRLLPSSPAALSHQLSPGDVILAVNGQTVDMYNVASVMSFASSDLALLVRKVHHAHSLTPSHPPPPQPHNSGLVRLVMGGGGRKEMLRLTTDAILAGPHLLLFLTLNTREEDPADKDIIYQFPLASESSEDVDSLLRLRGIFLTLSDILSSITTATTSCSTLSLGGGRLVHVACTQRGKELLLLALPAQRVSRRQAQLLVEKLDAILTFLYGSLQLAFSSRETHAELNHLFTLFFDSLVAAPPSTTLTTLTTPTPHLPLPTDLRVKVSAALSSLDSAEHGTRSPELLLLPRPFSLASSCLLHRGYLLASHMTQPDLAEVLLLCRAYRLLELTAAAGVSQVVLWREVFLSRLRRARGERPDPVYSESPGRTFLLIVGLDSVLVCMLLRQEPHPPLPAQATPIVVDAIYIDRARALILELKATDILTQCDAETIYSPSPTPALTSADVCLTASVAQATQRRPSQTRRLTHSVSQSYTHSRDHSDSNEEETGGVAGGNPLFTPKASRIALRSRSQSALTKPTFKTRKKASKNGGVPETLPPPPALNPTSLRPPYTLTAGPENVLLHYVCFSPGQGVLVVPAEVPSSSGRGGMGGDGVSFQHGKLLQCFQCTSQAISEVLLGRRRRRRCGGSEWNGMESDSETDSDSGSEGSGGELLASKPKKNVFAPPRGSRVIEHGVLVEWSSLPQGEPRGGGGGGGGGGSIKGVPSLSYWVIGRLFPESGQQFFVCCQESASQNLIEMAFKLLFGWQGF